MSKWIQSNLVAGDPENLTRPFECRFLSCSQQTLSFDDACDYTAHKISQDYKNLYLALSGGLDSICVANVLKRNQIDFVPVILTDANSASDPDLWYAHQWCHANRVTPLQYKLDEKNYDTVAKKILSYAIKNHTYASSIYLSCFLTEIIPKDASLITGDGEPLHVPEHYYDVCPDHIEIYEGCYYLNLTFGAQHPGGFFKYTPELFSAMVREANLSKNTQEIKGELYGLPPRPKIFRSQKIWKKFSSITDKFYKAPHLQLHRMTKQYLLDMIG